MEFNYQIEEAISAPRLNTYRSLASSDDHAWALYRWNIDLAAEVAPIAADLEVTLRNTIHDRLTDHFDRGDWWAANSLLLDDVTAKMLTDVVRKHQKHWRARQGHRRHHARCLGASAGKRWKQRPRTSD
ncbi:MAG: hypothetical protein KTV16_06260 [Acidimicrobiia bacterium]|nr:hypothetical protein [Acidimicrobiia bacterium]